MSKPLLNKGVRKFLDVDTNGRGEAVGQVVDGDDAGGCLKTQRAKEINARKEKAR